MFNITGTRIEIVPTMQRICLSADGVSSGGGSRVGRATVEPQKPLVQLDMPPMVDVPGQGYRITEGVAPVSLGRQLVAAGYEITGDNAEGLRRALSIGISRDKIFPDFECYSRRFSHLFEDAFSARLKFRPNIGIKDIGKTIGTIQRQRRNVENPENIPNPMELLVILEESFLGCGDLMGLSLQDARALAQKLNEQNRRFRVPTKKELMVAHKLLGNQLAESLCELTESVSRGNEYFLYDHELGSMLTCPANERRDDSTARLVEDI